MTAPVTIFILATEQTYYGRDNRLETDTQVQDDYGYFTDRATAEAKADELNAPSRARFEESQKRARRAHAAEEKKAERRRIEIETLRVAGITPTVSPLPQPRAFTPSRFEDEKEGTTWVLVEVEPAQSEDTQS